MYSWPEEYTNIAEAKRAPFGNKRIANKDRIKGNKWIADGIQIPVKTRSRLPRLKFISRQTHKRQILDLHFILGQSRWVWSYTTETHSGCTPPYRLLSPTEGYNGESKEWTQMSDYTRKFEIRDSRGVTPHQSIDQTSCLQDQLCDWTYQSGLVNYGYKLLIST